MSLVQWMLDDVNCKFIFIIWNGPWHKWADLINSARTLGLVLGTMFSMYGVEKYLRDGQGYHNNRTNLVLYNYIAQDIT